MLGTERVSHTGQGPGPLSEQLCRKGFSSHCSGHRGTGYPNAPASLGLRTPGGVGAFPRVQPLQGGPLPILLSGKDRTLWENRLTAVGSCSGGPPVLLRREGGSVSTGGWAQRFSWGFLHIPCSGGCGHVCSSRPPWGGPQALVGGGRFVVLQSQVSHISTLSGPCPCVRNCECVCVHVRACVVLSLEGRCDSRVFPH